MIADFPLQFDVIFRWKVKYRYFGVIPHILIHLTAMIICLLPYLQNASVLVAIGMITTVHYFIDIGKIELNKLIFRTKHNPYKELYYFFLDQIIHFLTIFFACLISLRGINVLFPPGFDAPWMKHAFSASSDSIVWLIIVLAFVTYGTPVISYTLSGIVFDPREVEFKGSFREEFFSKLYRALIIILMYEPRYSWFVIVPSMMVIIYFFTRKHLHAYKYFKEMVATLSTILLGVMMRLVQIWAP